MTWTRFSAPTPRRSLVFVIVLEPGHVPLQRPSGRSQQHAGGTASHSFAYFVIEGAISLDGRLILRFMHKMTKKCGLARTCATEHADRDAWTLRANHAGGLQIYL